MTRPVDYTYTIRYLPESEDGPIFACTVAEFPDMTAYEDYPTQAYWTAVDFVEGAIALAEEMGHEYPLPKGDKE